MSAAERMVAIADRRAADDAARRAWLPPTESYADALAILDDLPDALKRCRAWRGATQSQAAQAVSVTLATWCEWEAGRRVPHGDRAAPVLDWVRATHTVPDRRGRCVSGKHLLAEVGVRRRADGSTRCRGCANETKRAWYHRKARGSAS